MPPALAILVWTKGYVALLVVLYTVNVFITFALSLLGLTRYWWQQRRDVPRARNRFLLAAFALLITVQCLGPEQSLAVAGTGLHSLRRH